MYGTISHRFGVIDGNLGENSPSYGVFFPISRGTTMTAFDRIFRAHPQAVNETYGEHRIFAFGFSARLFWAALAAFIHGLVPCLCETTASRAVLDMNDEIRARRRLMAEKAVRA
jgi:hypothetical protein